MSLFFSLLFLPLNLSLFLFNSFFQLLSCLFLHRSHHTFFFVFVSQCWLLLLLKSWFHRFEFSLLRLRKLRLNFSKLCLMLSLHLLKLLQMVFFSSCYFLFLLIHDLIDFLLIMFHEFSLQVIELLLMLLCHSFNLILLIFLQSWLLHLFLNINLFM